MLRRLQSSFLSCSELDLLYVCGVPRFDFESIGYDNVTEVVDRRSEKVYLWDIQSQARMLYNFEDLPYVSEVFFKGIGVEYDAVDIDQTRGPPQSGEENVQSFLGGRRRMTQPEEHSLLLETSAMRSEGGLMSVFWAMGSARGP